MSVAVIKLGVGNTASVLFALDRLGIDAVLTDDPIAVADAERVILPGVGAASAAMKRLVETGLADALRKFTRPLLGICLGQQLLFERSDEGDVDCLGLFPGHVRALPASYALPSPHTGWSELYLDQPHHPLAGGVKRGDQVYFVHAFACPLGPQTLAVAHHGRAFSAMVARRNVFGCQFHPERSGAVGARILANFLSIPC